MERLLKEQIISFETAKLAKEKGPFSKTREIQEDFKMLSDEWVQILGEEKKLPKSLSPFDHKKISELEQSFD